MNIGCFCDVDDVTYGGLKKIGFTRTKTLGYGGDCCDFHFLRSDSGRFRDFRYKVQVLNTENMAENSLINSITESVGERYIDFRSI